MPLFGKKREEPSKLLDEIRKAVDGTDSLQPDIRNLEMKLDEPKLPEQKPVEQKKEEVRHKEVKEPERPSFAPLFVKIDRYRQILNAIGYLKTTMIMIKNSLMTLNELDKARDETFKLIQDAVEKLEGRLSILDQELIRPTGYHEIAEKPEYQDVETVEATIADLKGQIEQLRVELQEMT